MVLSILMTILFSFSFLSFISKAKISFRSECLKETINLQKKLIQAEKKLFFFNFPARTLEIRLLKASAIAVAVPGTPAGIAALAEVTAIQLEQLRLDKVQKVIIFTATLEAQAETLRIQRKLTQMSHSLGKVWSFYIRTLFVVSPAQITEMAVQPLRFGFAPTYELKPQYKRLQAVAFNWQFQYWTKSESQDLFQSSNSFQLSCGTEPERNGEVWTVEIQKDKFY